MLSVYVNTEVKMPKRMFDAIGIFEAICCVTGKKTCTEDEVRAYLREKHGDKLADAFRPEYMFKSRAGAENPE